MQETRQKPKVYFRIMASSSGRPTPLHNVQAAVSVVPSELSCIRQAGTMPTAGALLPRDPSSASLQEHNHSAESGVNAALTSVLPASFPRCPQSHPGSELFLGVP